MSGRIKGIIIAQLLAVLLSGAWEANRYRKYGRRVFDGVPDVYNRYSYVVSIEFGRWRYCTGTLIARNWVLTAAQCYLWSRIRYGNMTTLDNKKQTYSKIIKRIAHPGFRWLMNEDLFHYMYNNIALMQVEDVRLSVYGNISALDYKSLQGVAVEYAGYGTTFYEADNFSKAELQDEFRRLQLGKGMVVPSCPEWYTGPVMCVAPKCNRRYQQPMMGDSGGPLFYDGKIIGVLGLYPWEGELFGYVPVSPYLSWISDTLTAENKK